jgi:hypothetical protein
MLSCIREPFLLSQVVVSKIHGFMLAGALGFRRVMTGPRLGVRGASALGTHLAGSSQSWVWGFA